jgi:LuxR family maltose regulon positive regulatory protein
LIWSAQRQRYEVCEPGNEVRHPLTQDEVQWHAWLATCSSFSFQGQSGRLTLRKESRARGRDHYWYAYCRLGGRLAKRYIGRTADLTLERLEETARSLTTSGAATFPPALMTKTFPRERGSASQTRKPMPLLAPKLYLPQPSGSLIARERLLTRLNAGLECKLTLLSAPPGFGKTTLASQWVASLRMRHPPVPVAWVALDADDNDPLRFWRYVIRACQEFRPDLGEAALTFLLGLSPSRQPSLEDALTALLNDLATLPHRSILVLEDYHLISSQQIHQALAAFVNHLPAALHLILISRLDPPLPLARLRAHNDLTELHAEDLRFSVEETRLFFQRAAPFACTSEISQHVHQRTEGWATGLRLLTFALQRLGSASEAERFLLTFTGGQRHLLEYFVTEVLDTQPEELQLFLLRTSVLERLTASLCNAVIGRNDSASQLATLEQAEMFLLPLNEMEASVWAERWYRYHALFAEALRQEAYKRLGEEELRRCARCASAWYESRGMLSEAIEAAFSAKETTRAAHLLERLTDLSHFLGADDLGVSEFPTLRRWLEQVPEEELRRRPALCVSYAMLLGFTPTSHLQRDDAKLEVLLQQAEQCWRAEENTARLGEIAAFRALLATWQEQIQPAEVLARQALAWLPETATVWRSMALGIVGAASLQQGLLEEARQQVLPLIALAERIGHPTIIRPPTLLLGDICWQEGALQQAAELYQRVLASAGEDAEDKSSALIGLANLSYEWNHLARAEQEAREALALGKHLADASRQVHASLVLAQVLRARGESIQAQQVVQTLLREQWPPQLTQEILVCQARLAWAGGNVAAGKLWAETDASPQAPVPLLQQEQAALLQARLLLAQRNADETLHLLAAWQRTAEVSRRARSLLTIQVLMSLAYAQSERGEQAGHVLREALALASVSGFQRLLLDEGAEVAKLVQAIWPTVRKEPCGPYVGHLLLAFTREPGGSTLPPVPILEGLSVQERRVLRLLEAGLSSPEIASELVVSLNTVKTHLKNIYRKLDVHTRKAALAEARHLNLL